MKLYIHEILKTQLGISQKDVDKYTRGMYLKEYEKGEPFIEHGAPANKLGIVINGSFIGFKQEKLRTAILIVNQFNWVGDLPQFIFKGNAKKSVIAIEESEVLVLPHSFHEHMMKNDEQYQDIFLKQLAHSIDNYEERLEVLQTGSVSDKIKYLKEKFPKLFSHGKLKYLANFLDISQEAFSRNLKKIEDS